MGTDLDTETVMMIANIVDSLPPKKHKGPRTTLIVVTNALVVQWASEIQKHARDEKTYKLKVLIYAKKQLITNDPVQTIEDFDIV